MSNDDYEQKTDVRTITSVLVEHEGIAGLDLSVEDSIPQFVSIDRPPSPALAFISLVELLELVTPNLMKARRLVGAE